MSTLRTTKGLGINGTKFTLDGKPFYFQALTFFNALYNERFNRSPAERTYWLRKFKANGINVVRILCQWDWSMGYTQIDLAPHNTMYSDQGAIRERPFGRLAALLEAADQLDMVIEVVMFVYHKSPYFLQVPAQERAVRELTERLRPYGNVLQQITCEYSLEWRRYLAAARAADPDRILTIAPGWTFGENPRWDHIGDDDMNRALEVLTPHTLRAEAFPFWYLAPAQIEYLLDTYKKPVIDDSPARSGPVQYGGNAGGTTPEQHIEHIRRVRAIGGYHGYLHDMFQYGYGHPLTPPSGIPDPDFSPFHRKVFDYLRDHPTW